MVEMVKKVDIDDIGEFNDSALYITELNPYHVLGIDKNDSFDEIRIAYKKGIIKTIGKNKKFRAKVSLAFDMLSEQRQANNYQNQARDTFRVIKKDWFYYSITGNYAVFKENFEKENQSTQKKILNQTDELKRTVLYITARCGFYDLCEYLLKNGAWSQLNSKQENGSTALHGAAFYGQGPIIKLLLSHGSEISIKNQYKSTAYDEAYDDRIKSIMDNYKKHLIQEFSDDLNQKLGSQQNKYVSQEVLYHQKKNGENVVKAIRIKKLNIDSMITSDYEKLYHGTKYKYLDSILQNGLKAPGTKINGKQLQTRKGHIQRNIKIGDFQDWSGAVFLSPSIFYSSDIIYAERIMSNQEQFCCIVEAFVKPGSYTSHQHTLVQYQQKLGEPTDIEYRVQSTKLEESMMNSIVRVDQKDDDNIITASVLFVRLDFLTSDAKMYADAEMPW